MRHAKWQNGTMLVKAAEIAAFLHCSSCPAELLTQPCRHCCHFSFSRSLGCLGFAPLPIDKQSLQPLDPQPSEPRSPYI